MARSLAANPIPPWQQLRRRGGLPRHGANSDQAAAPPANDDRKSAIVTIRPRGKRYADVADLSPEEHKRRGDAADALFQEPMRSRI